MFTYININKSFSLLLALLLSFSGICSSQAENKSNNVLKGRITVDVNSDKLEYFQDKNDFIATGKADVFIQENNSRLQADKITFNQDKQLIIAENNVKIIKKGKVIKGSYARINLNDESALVDNPESEIGQINVKAQVANVYTDKITLLKGNAVINTSGVNLSLNSNGIAPQSEIENTDTKVYTGNKQRYRIVSKEISVTKDGERTSVKVKKASVYVGKLKIAYVPSLEITNDQSGTRAETMLPEIGYMSQLGWFVGPSFVFNLPKSSSLKISPAMMFGKDTDGKNTTIGGGGFLRFMTEKNKTELGYGTLKERLIVKGEYKFTPNTKFVYGARSYVNEGIFGSQKPKYVAEVVDYRKLASAMNLDFFLRSSAGYASEQVNPGYEFGTSKFQLQGTLINSKPLLQFKEYLQLGALSQGNISVYGNGNTQGILRAGPRLSSKIGPLSTFAMYMQGAEYGKTPFLFDRYIQGKSNLIVGGDVKLSKYFNIGNIRNMNLLKDNYNNKLTTENQIYVKFGPEDFKLKVGYDIIRRSSTFGVDLMLGAGRTGVKFDTMNLYNMNQ